MQTCKKIQHLNYLKYSKPEIHSIQSRHSRHSRQSIQSIQSKRVIQTARAIPPAIESCFNMSHVVGDGIGAFIMFYSTLRWAYYRKQREQYEKENDDLKK